MYCLGLQNIDEVGDATANNIKHSLDTLFENVDLKEEWEHSLVSVCADGASVNTGAYNGLLKQLEVDREWLIKTHCVSHRIELAIKNSLLSEKSFSDIREFLVSLYYYCKRSGKFVRHMSETAASFSAPFTKLPKVHGTRFVSHQKNGAEALINDWVVLLQGIENSLENSAQKNAKLGGYLKKLKNIEMFFSTLLFMEFLSILAPLSVKFQKADLQVFEIMGEIEETLSNLDDALEDVSQCRLLDKYKFEIKPSDSGAHILSKTLLKEGHSRRSQDNQEWVTLHYEKMVGDLEKAQDHTQKLAEKTVQKVKRSLKERFCSFQNEDVLRNCMWLNPETWDEANSSEELKAMHAVVNHFEIPLSRKKFEPTNLKREWKGLKTTVKNYYSKHSPKSMWASICKYRHLSYPNVCLLVNLVQCLGMSTAIVESGFSHLTALLTDRRLSMSHSTMEASLLIKVNDLQITESERNKILEAGLESYLSKRRITKMCDSNESAINVDDPIPRAAAEPELLSLESDSDSDSNSDLDSDICLSDCATESSHTSLNE